MSGETDLGTMLRGLRPELHEAAWVFCTLPAGRIADLPEESLGIFREAEGLTLIIGQAVADRLGYSYEAQWAWISLSVYSSLQAVGLMAAVSSALARAGISVNPVAGFYHDHLFVPWEERWKALEVLGELSRGLYDRA